MSRVRRGLLELLLVAGLYVAYTASRMLADQDVTAALGHAHELLAVEGALGIAREHAVNAWFVAHDTIGLLASFWYAAGHYVVTAGALVWLYSRGRSVYVPARRALAAATVIGLVCYLLMPTAPPRMLAGYVDVLSRHADLGWWGSDASAPQGLGGLTNELAAFPSLHAGWSLWVALAATTATASRLARGLAWAYAATTAVVVIGTANHWTVDVLVGWMVALAGWVLADVLGRIGWRALALRGTSGAVVAAAGALDAAVTAVGAAGAVLPGMVVPPRAVRRIVRPGTHLSPHVDDLWRSSPGSPAD